MQALFVTTQVKFDVGGGKLVGVRHVQGADEGHGKTDVDGGARIIDVGDDLVAYGQDRAVALERYST